LAAPLYAVLLVAAVPAGGESPAPIKLAVFEFELEDLSAGASVAGVSAADAAQLADVTSEVRRLLAQSARYRPIDGGIAAGEPAPSRPLHDCDGCDAAMARKLGAEQSLVGVVRRISRTEYTVRFQIRDAASGAVLADEDSGLQMGADYSWSRGAARLIRGRLLEKPNSP
jgi:hypothetical protein